jgi:hypothetical protein
MYLLTILFYAFDKWVISTPIQSAPLPVPVGRYFYRVDSQILKKDGRHLNKIRHPRKDFDLERIVGPNFTLNTFCPYRIYTRLD